MGSRYEDYRGRGRERDRSRDRGYGTGGGRFSRRGNDRMMGGGEGRRGGPPGGGGGGGGMGMGMGEPSGGGAEHLARIHGTEEDRVNCPFYFKIGACRHGDRCSRLHNKPVFSQTVLIKHMYDNPIAKVIAQNGDPNMLDHKEVDEEFEDFYEEVFEELCKFGKLEELNICDNLGDHLVGNVYAKYKDEEHAAAAQKALYGRFYAGKPLVCEFSPVTDFREARCRQFDEGTCNRGGYCNFMHIKTVSRALQREFEQRYNRFKDKSRRSTSRSKSRSRSRSRSPSGGRGAAGKSQSRSRSRSRSGSRSRDRDGRKSHRRSRSKSKERRGGGSSRRDQDRKDPSSPPAGPQ